MRLYCVVALHSFNSLVIPLLFVQVGLASSSCGGAGYPPIGYMTWNHSRSTRTDLLCPLSCLTSPDYTDDNREKCCYCESVSPWEISSCGNDVIDLYAEYMDLQGGSLLLSESTTTTTAATNGTIFSAIHRNGFMTSLPTNMCLRPNTVILDFQKNKIKEISDIRCLKGLNMLFLDYNCITHIDNTTFSELKNLRKLSITFNRLKTVDINFLTLAEGIILDVNLAHNDIQSIDIVDVMKEGGVCKVNVSYNNKMEEMTNILGFVFNETSTYGPGDIDLSFSSVSTFPNLTKYGVTDFTNILSYIVLSIEFEGTSIMCDCNLYPLLAHGGGYDVFRIWKNVADDLNGVNCSHPESLRGITIREIIESSEISMLTCTVIEECPRFCSCIDKPSEDHVLVNCSGRGLTQLPADMPIGSWQQMNLFLLMDDNDIPSVDDVSYIHRVKYFNLSGNPIGHIDGHAFSRLPQHTQIDISGHQQLYLPQEIMLLDPSQVTFGTNNLVCNCSTTWLADWLQINNAKDKIVYCDVTGDTMRALDVTSDLLHCDVFDDQLFLNVGIGVTVATAFTSIVTLLVVCLRFEIKLLLRQVLRKEYYAKADTMYDVFISFDEEDKELFSFVINQIRPMLLKKGHAVCIPFFNIEAGSITEERLREDISNSRNYVIVLSENYFNSRNTGIILSTLWQYYRWDEERKVIFVNFYKMPKSKILDKRIRAFLRMGDVIDFSERENRMIERLDFKIGPPVNHSNTPGLGKPTRTFDQIHVEAEKHAAEKGDVSNGDVSKEDVWNDDVLNEVRILTGIFSVGVDRKEMVPVEEHSFPGTSTILSMRPGAVRNPAADRRLPVCKRHPSVWDRLQNDTKGQCNCKFRVCSLHDESLFKEEHLSQTPTLHKAQAVKQLVISQQAERRINTVPTFAETARLDGIHLRQNTECVSTIDIETEI